MARLKRKCRKDSKILLSVNVGTDQTGKKFEDAVNAIIQESTVKSVTVLVADSLQRYNYLCQGFTEDEAMKKSSADGDKWIEENNTTIESLRKHNIKVNTVRWEEIRTLDEFKNSLASVKELYDGWTPKEFRCGVEELAGLRARNFRSGNQKKISHLTVFQNCVDYLLEESSLQHFFGGTDIKEYIFDHECYSGYRNRAVKYIYNHYAVLGRMTENRIIYKENNEHENGGNNNSDNLNNGIAVNNLYNRLGMFANPPVEEGPTMHSAIVYYGAIIYGNK